MTDEELEYLVFGPDDYWDNRDNATMTADDELYGALYWFYLKAGITDSLREQGWRP